MTDNVDDSWKEDRGFVLEIYQDQLEEMITYIDGSPGVFGDHDIKHALCCLCDKLSMLFRLTEDLYYLTENIPPEED